MYIEPLLIDLHLTAYEIAYLNLFQSPTIANSRPTPRMFAKAWPWTRQQLEVLQPRMVVAGGKEVGSLLHSFWPAPPFRVLVQDRNRSLTTAVRQAWSTSASDEIRKAL
jgi:hypothetical protein